MMDKKLFFGFLWWWGYDRVGVCFRGENIQSVTCLWFFQLKIYKIQTTQTPFCERICVVRFVLFKRVNLF